MATNTTKLALSKPDGTDLVDVSVLNTNFDKIDAASGATICTSSTRPASPFNGQVIFETDTLNALVYRTSTSSWSIVGGSTVSSEPPAGAGNGNFWWDADNGKLYIYYNDGNSSQWVSVMPSQTTVDVSANSIINGAFEINQRSFTSLTSDGYGFDRWACYRSDGTVTYSTQSFTIGTAPVSGYEAKSFARVVTTGQTAAGAYSQLVQRIESVRTFAGQTVTVSFWAKAASGTPKMAIELQQLFGGGGSPSSPVETLAGQVTLSTSWARYSITVALPSIAGKTLGTAGDDSIALNFWQSAGTTFNTRSGSLGIQSNTFDIWGVQVEKGSVATSFKRAGVTLQGELAACQRYYQVMPLSTPMFGYNTASGALYIPITFPVYMRTAPTVSATFTSSSGSSNSVINVSTQGFILSMAATVGGVFYTTYAANNTASAEL